MDSMKNAPSKTLALILNAVVAALCTLSVAAYFFSPFLKIKSAIKFTPELAEKINSETDNSSASGENPDEQQIISDVITQMGKDGVKISMGFTLKTTDVFAAFNQDGGKSAINKIIDDNVKSVMNELDETITKVVGSVAKSTVKGSIKNSVKDAVGKNEDGTQKTIEADGRTYTVDEALNELGITDDFIDEQVDGVINSVMQKTTTVDEIADKMCDAVDNAYKKIAASDSEIKNKYLSSMPEELKGEDREKVKENIKKTLEELGIDANSEINGEDLLYTVIGNMLANADKNKEKSEEESATVGQITRFSASAGGGAAVGLSGESSGETGGESSGTQNKTYTKEDVQQMISDKLNAAITDQTRDALCNVMKGFCFLIIFTLATWAWLIVKMIIKLFFKNPMIRLGLPLWLGNIPFWLLFALPNAVFKILLNFNSAPSFLKNSLTNLLGEETISSLLSLGNTLSVSISSCAIIPFIVSVVMIVFCFFYCPVRKRLKRELRGD